MFVPGFPSAPNNNFTIYTATNEAGAKFTHWVKPIGIQWVWGLAVGGAGGGGPGGSTAATARAGGGGGGPGGVGSFLLPAFMLPDVLYVQAGRGGDANASVFTGPSTISLMAAYSTGWLLAEGVGGNNGGTGSSAGVATKNTLGWMLGFGVQTSFDAGAGGAFGANTGAAVTGVFRSSQTIPLTPGAGGAGSSAANSVIAGGVITGMGSVGAAQFPTIAGGAAGVSGTTPGGNGQHGQGRSSNLYHMVQRGMNAFAFSGGSGGGSGGASNGGIGGDGGWGCGGGGGGAGATGGAGGKGGDGFVIIGGW